jgi:ferric-dicitrate binding protein FerR (iron transport regulator)
MNELKNPKLVQAIEHFTRGNATPDEEKMLYNWVKETPENRKRLFGEKDLWEASQLGSPRFVGAEIGQWLELQGCISTKRTNYKISEIIKIAAIVILALGTGWLGHTFYSGISLNNSQAEQKTIEASKGQIKEIFLADRTHVWLNTDSRISYPTGFSENTREVELSGEAFFEVTASEEKPFLVKTGNHTVKVTGTRFNICEYPESKIIETTLEEGKVKIISGNLFKDLLPGEQSSFHTESAEIRISKTDLEIYTVWKEGRYDFNNEPVSKIFQIIERWWDVKIEYPEEALKNERISGVLRRYKPVEQHFEVIQQLVPMDYYVENDVITVSVKEKNR